MSMHADGNAMHRVDRLLSRNQRRRRQIDRNERRLQAVKRCLQVRMAAAEALNAAEGAEIERRRAEATV